MGELIPGYEFESDWSSEAAQAITDAVSRASHSGTPYAVFDFDNTCIAGDCGALIHAHISERLGWAFEDGFLDVLPEEVGRSRIVSLWEQTTSDSENDSLRRALMRELMLTFPRHLEAFGPEPTYAWATTLYAGLHETAVKGFARAMLRVEGSRPRREETIEPTETGEDTLTFERGLRIRPAFRALIEWLGQRGVRSVIVSASNRQTVVQASRWTGVAPEHVFGNEPHQEDGRYVARASTPVTWGPGKVDVLRELSAEPPVLAFGDSRTDQELLDYATTGILVDRGSPSLRRYAEEASWVCTPASQFRERPLVPTEDT